MSVENCASNSYSSLFHSVKDKTGFAIARRKRDMTQTWHSCRQSSKYISRMSVRALSTQFQSLNIALSHCKLNQCCNLWRLNQGISSLTFETLTEMASPLLLKQISHQSQRFKKAFLVDSHYCLHSSGVEILDERCKQPNKDYTKTLTVTPLQETVRFSLVKTIQWPLPKIGQQD